MTSSIIQWNCRGLAVNHEQLDIIISDYCPKIICLQETYLSTDNFYISNFSSYHHISSNNLRASGGSSIFVHSDVPHGPININSNLQVTTCSVTLSSVITICNLYIPPSYKLLRSDLDNLISQIPKPFILLGDFNSHSPTWGSSFHSTRGRLLDLFISDYDLCVLNKDSPTYLHPATGTFSNIDISLCDSSAVQYFSDWSVLPSSYGSDHFPIIISSPTYCHRNFSHNWNFKRANWDLFRNLCCNQITNYILDSNDPVSLFTSKLIEIANNCIPLNSSSSKPFKPWFNFSCKVAITDKNKALNLFKRHPTSCNLDNFKRLRAKARQIIKNSKKTYWEYFTSTLDTRVNASKVWNAIRSFKGQNGNNHISHLVVDDVRIASERGIANALASSFAYISSSDHYSPSFRVHKRKCEAVPFSFASDNSESYNCPFTLDELQNAIARSGSTSKGPDHLHYSFFKNLPPSSLNVLLAILNKLWLNDCFPPSWSSSIIIPIPKPGKDKSIPSNYRPIALTSCLCKIMERIINCRLSWFLEANDLFSKSQCGYRHFRNCLDHVTKLDTFIRNSFIRNHHTIAVFFDIEKAFDTTWRFGILRDLFNYGFRGHLPLFIKNFLHLRNFKVRVGSSLSDNFIQHCGVPQGSILSPTLFALKINNIAKVLSPNVSSSLYVDDLAIYASSPDLNVLVNNLQYNINSLSRWCGLNGFRFSPQKSVLIHFHNFNSIFPTPILLLNGLRISCAEHTRFLGITFDAKLTFIPHILNLKKNCVSSLNILRTLSHHSWGANRLTLLTLFRSLVRSKIDFGSFIYSAARKHYLKLILTIENEALRLCLGAFRTSPISSLHAEAVELPFRFRSLKYGLNFASRVLSSPSHPCFNIIRTPPFSNLYSLNKRIIPPVGLRLSSHLKNINLVHSCILASRPSITPPWSFDKPSIYLSLSTFSKSNYLPSFFTEKYKLLSRHFTDYSFIFTDGSVGDGAVGAAAVCPGLNLSARLPNASTIFSAEAHAILLALNFIDLSFKTKFVIFSDSKSVLMSLKNYNSQNPLIINILSKLSNIAYSGKKVILFWIPSHVGISGNDRADSAANKARNLSISDHIKIPYTDFKSVIHHYLFSTWQTDWKKDIGNKLFSVKPSVSSKVPIHSLYH